MQTNFVYPSVKDIVHDRKNKIEGRVSYIDHKSKTAKIEVIIKVDKVNQIRTTQLIDSSIYDLIVLEKHTAKEGKPTMNQENRQYDLVKEFHEAFNHPVADKPKPIEPERGLNRTIWTGEELVEFLHALSKNKEQFAKLYYEFLEGLQKAYMKSLNAEYIQDEVERVVAQADALTDTSYFLNGTFVEIGVKPQPMFEIVQNSNMSKLFTAEDGTKFAKYREDGKIQKSPEFFAPEQKLKEEVLRQAKA